MPYSTCSIEVYNCRTYMLSGDKACLAQPPAFQNRQPGVVVRGCTTRVQDGL